MTADGGSVRLAAGARYRRVRNAGVLLVPEGVVKLNRTAAAIVELIDRRRTAADIVRELRERYGERATLAADVDRLLQRLAERSWIEFVEEACDGSR
jgi:pyrroloquinoline quinone biosynthesis protein D